MAKTVYSTVRDGKKVISSSHACAYMCARTHLHTHHALTNLFQWDVFLKDTTKLTLLICILLYPLIPCVMFYCWSVLCPCLWCIFSKCSTSDLSLLNHLVDFWPYLPIFKSIWKPDPILWGAASCSQHCIICWFYNHTAFKSLGLLRKYPDRNSSKQMWEIHLKYIPGLTELLKIYFQEQLVSDFSHFCVQLMVTMSRQYFVILAMAMWDMFKISWTSSLYHIHR